MPDKNTIEGLLQKSGENRNSTVVALLLPSGPIMQEYLLKLKNEIGGTHQEMIDLFIHSGGGDIHTAYQIVEFLRLHCDHLHVVIPLSAKSAATLLSLGADSLILDVLADRGPLDTQIMELGKGGKREYTSALNPFKT